ncbi:putative efflux pump antibiotic resistance protein [Hypomontagnella monticulosa]|nr:putative efflux pump antibiotic resistance protein [Hypomontagnella monticulosa]
MLAILDTMSSTTQLAQEDGRAEKNGLSSVTAQSHDDDGVQVREVKGVLWFLVVVAVLSATFLYALDNTVMANVRPSIVETFDRIDMLPWLSVSYPMGEVGANPLWGKLNNYFNNKVLYLAAILIFEVGSVVIGSAQNIGAVVVGRVIAGLGGSGIYVGTMNILSAMTVPAERNQYLTFVGMAWSLGTILGPVIGGAFADSAATWRWAFYINICIAAVTTPVCIWLIPPVLPSQSHGLLERLKKIDYLGAVLFLGGVASIVMVLGFGGAVYDWRSGQMIGLYVATVVIWAAFCFQQGFSLLTVDRIFPVHLVSDRLMVSMFFWSSIAIANIVVTVYSLPLFFQFTFGDSSLRSAVYTLPFVISTIVLAAIISPFFSKFPIYMLWFAGASAVMLIGGGLLSTIDYNTSRATICGYTVVQGVGLAPVIQLAYTVAQAKVQRSTVPEVTAFLSCAQMAGLALSLGIATSVFLNGATADIAKILPGVTHDLIQRTIDGAKTGLIQDLEPGIRQQVLEAIARNVGKVFYLNVAGSALGFVMALLMKRERLVLAPQ